MRSVTLMIPGAASGLDRLARRAEAAPRITACAGGDSLDWPRSIRDFGVSPDALVTPGVEPSLDHFLAQVAAPRAGNGVLALRQFANDLLQLYALQPGTARQRP